MITYMLCRLHKVGYEWTYIFINIFYHDVTILDQIPSKINYTKLQLKGASQTLITIF